jgi:hypothetical protein
MQGWGESQITSRRGKWQHSLVLVIEVLLLSDPTWVTVAEEEGFDFSEYGGGTCWRALVRYSREIEKRNLRSAA